MTIGLFRAGILGSLFSIVAIVSVGAILGKDAAALITKFPFIAIFFGVVIVLFFLFAARVGWLE